MSQSSKLQVILEAPLADLGYDIVQLNVSGGKRPILEVLIDRIDEAPVTVQDCAKASKTISVLLDVADPLPSAYMLEVSSPGVARPLTRLKDYQRFQGREVKLELFELHQGQKRFRGTVGEVLAEEIQFMLDTGENLVIPLSYIHHCKLVPVL